MSATIFDLLPDTVKQQWDKEDYKILCPENLDDEAVIKVVLINTNETEIEIELPIQAGS